MSSSKAKFIIQKDVKLLSTYNEILWDIVDGRKNQKTIVLLKSKTKVGEALQEYVESIKSGDIQTDINLYNYWQEPIVYSDLNNEMNSCLTKEGIDYLRYPKTHLWSNQIICMYFSMENGKDTIEQFVLDMLEDKKIVELLKQNIIPLILLLLIKYDNLALVMDLIDKKLDAAEQNKRKEKNTKYLEKGRYSIGFRLEQMIFSIGEIKLGGSFNLDERIQQLDTHFKTKVDLKYIPNHEELLKSVRLKTKKILKGVKNRKLDLKVWLTTIVQAQIDYAESYMTSIAPRADNAKILAAQKRELLKQQMKNKMHNRGKNILNTLISSEPQEMALALALAPATTKLYNCCKCNSPIQVDQMSNIYCQVHATNVSAYPNLIYFR